ncbi:MAG: AAA family ATPase [Nanoarchaeota archaeon]
MPNLFKDMLKGDESLFLDIGVLDPDFIPPVIEGRENEQQWIASCIKPLFLHRPGRHAFITGSPGIGKTLAVRYLLQELEQETQEIFPVYINCWKKDSPHKIMLALCEALGYTFVQNRTVGELLEEIAKIINKKSAVLVLDEADKILDESILYHLLESLLPISLLLVSNDAEYLSVLDDRIISRLHAEEIVFASYTFDETYQILQKRAHHAFVPHVFEKDAFDLLVQKAFALRDIRAGLFLLREAGEQAESHSSRKIQLRHAESALTILSLFKIRSSAGLNEDDQKLLQLIKNHSGITMSELYALYKRHGQEKTYRTFNRKIDVMAKQRIITKKTISAYPGRTTKVYYGGLLPS